MRCERHQEPVTALDGAQCSASQYTSTLQNCILCCHNPIVTEPWFWYPESRTSLSAPHSELANTLRISSAFRHRDLGYLLCVMKDMTLDVARMLNSNQLYRYIYIYIYMYAQIHVYIHIHTYIHIYICVIHKHYANIKAWKGNASFYYIHVYYYY